MALLFTVAMQSYLLANDSLGIIQYFEPLISYLKNRKTTLSNEKAAPCLLVLVRKLSASFEYNPAVTKKFGAVSEAAGRFSSKVTLLKKNFQKFGYWIFL